MIGHGIGQRRETGPFRQHPLQVDVGELDLRRHGVAGALHQESAVLGDEGVAIPGQIGGGLTRPGSGVHIG